MSEFSLLFLEELSPLSLELWLQEAPSWSKEDTSVSMLNTFVDWQKDEGADSTSIDIIPSDTLFAVREEDKKIVGAIEIRHSIDHPLLEKYGGHIGFIVLPSERGKGYAPIILKKGLDYCKDVLHLPKVMISSYADNIASIKTIVNCGGIKKDERKDALGNLYFVYWISLEEKNEKA